MATTHAATHERDRAGARGGRADGAEAADHLAGRRSSAEDARGAPDARIGSVLLGRYRLLHCRHAGPRSRVYEVEPPGVGQSRRALKLLGVPEAQNPQAQERLSNLAEGLRGLDHPHLEHVFALGRLDDETPFLVTEWLPLPTLAAWLAAEPRPTRARALQVVRGVASALGALHHRGLAHGDVRPAHVLVESGLGVFERVVLADAGLADALGTAMPRDLDGWLAGAAPERLTLGSPGRRFERGAPSAAADVYALAVLAWRLLTGAPPFRPEDPRAAAAGLDPAERLIHLHRHHRPVWPCAPDGAPWLSPALWALLGQSLAKDPAERPADADCFLDLLEAAVAWPDAEGGGEGGAGPHGEAATGAPPPAVARFFAGPDDLRVEAPTVALEAQAPEVAEAPGAAPPAAPAAPVPDPEPNGPRPVIDGSDAADAPEILVGTAGASSPAALGSPPPDPPARAVAPAPRARWQAAWPWLAMGLAVGVGWAALLG